MRKHILFTLMALLSASPLTNAIPARPGRLVHTQPDGTKIDIRRHGDEFAHWTTDAAGRLVELSQDGYYRPVTGITVDEIQRKGASRRALARRGRSRVVTRAGGDTPIAIGQKHFLVILVEFKNKAFSTSADPNAAFTALLNESGYSVNGGTGSARDYYYDNSGGLFEPVFDVYGPVRLENNYSYYGANDKWGNDLRAEDALIQGCEGLDAEIDFSRYDNDGDGKVDLVFMYYAGYGEADSSDSNTIWPHQYEVSSAGKSLRLDEVDIDSYACTNEVEGMGTYMGMMCGIGTACHEFGHAMGLPDFYDTDYRTNGQAAGLFFFSTMDSGAYNQEGRTPPFFNIEERIILGWLKEEDAILSFPESGRYSIPPVQENLAYRTPTDQNGEYFLYECRGSEGWDAGLSAHGLVVYHVDKSDRKVTLSGDSVAAHELWDDWALYNAINENGSHPCFYVVPSADQENLLFGHYLYEGNYYFDEAYSERIPFPGLDPVTRFIPVSWNRVNGSVSFRDIAFDGGEVSLYAQVPSGNLDYATITDEGSYRAGDRFSFALTIPNGRETPASVVWYYDDEPVSADSVTLTAGDHTVEAILTFAGGRSEILTLEISAN